MGYLPRGGGLLIFADWSAGGDLDEMLYWERSRGLWVLYSWSGFRPTFQRKWSWSSTVDIAVTGDYDTDGRADDLFLYDIGAGDWAIYSFHRNVPALATRGRWGAGYDAIAVGSFMD
jgi:hypothetical protein